MKITEVKIFRLNGESKIKGFTTVTFDDCLVAKGFKIIEGSNGAFVSMPSEKVNEEYKDTVFPITKEFREELIGAILGKYNEEPPQEGFYPVEGDDLPTPF